MYEVIILFQSCALQLNSYLEFKSYTLNVNSYLEFNVCEFKY